MKKFIPKTIGIGRLQRQASSILKEIMESGEDCFVFSRNEPQVVIISLGRYEKLKEIEEETLPNAEESFKQGWEEVMNGKVMPIETLWDDIDE